MPQLQDFYNGRIFEVYTFHFGSHRVFKGCNRKYLYYRITGSFILHLKLIVYDFDGVMTDNKAYLTQSGEEMVRISRADGLGVDKIKKLGIKQLILSSEENSIVSVRASKLKIPCLQGIEDKKTALMKYCRENNHALEFVGYVGNDINDMDVMGIVKITFCPADSSGEIKQICDFILKTNGGDGVIREIFNLINNKRK